MVTSIYYFICFIALGLQFIWRIWKNNSCFLIFKHFYPTTHTIKGTDKTNHRVYTLHTDLTQQNCSWSLWNSLLFFWVPKLWWPIRHFYITRKNLKQIERIMYFSGRLTRQAKWYFIRLTLSYNSLIFIKNNHVSTLLHNHWLN